MNSEFMALLDEIEKSKGISRELLIDAIEQSVVSAYKRHYGAFLDVTVQIDRETGAMKIFCKKTVVDEVIDPEIEMTLDEAKAINMDYQLGDALDVETMPASFGRIAAQTARQIVVQKLREGERNMVFDQFSDKEGKIVSGVVKCYDKRNVVFDVSGAEAVLAMNEQVSGEVYSPGKRFKLLVVSVNKTQRGPQVFVSRSHPNLVRRLFELEVPEIQSGIIEVKSISREPSARTKIAVWSTDSNIDPIGACIGARGSRVQNIVSELNGEKIDIIKYSEDIVEFVSAALSPAKVTHAYISEKEKICNVIVPDNQLSLAIGKEGQNARLAAKLTGWKVDIKSENTAATSE